jgi:hypothetical protein
MREIRIRQQAWYRLGWIGLLLTIGCAQTNVETVKEYSGQEQLPRPTRVLVKDFAVSPEDVSLNSGPGARLANVIKGTPKNEEQIKVGRAAAKALSDALVKEISALGLSAERAPSAAAGGERILIVDGQFVSIDEGNRARRMVIGFGAGATSVKTHVQVTFGTPTGALVVEQFETKAESSKKPGMGPMVGVGAAATSAASAAAVSGAVGTASEFNQDVEGDAARTAKQIAKSLSKFFYAQGWISKDQVVK